MNDTINIHKKQDFDGNATIEQRKKHERQRTDIPSLPFTYQDTLLP